MEVSWKMTNIDSIKNLAFEYVISLKNNYNPQTIANTNFLLNLEKGEVLNILDLPIKSFLKKYKPYKAKDFIYKNDYFTPRNMFLIHPLYYLYYTYLVFSITKESFKTDQINFSRKNMKIFYSGQLDFGSTKEQIRINARYSNSYKKFKEEQRKYQGKAVLKIDIKDFFNSITVKQLINKLKDEFGDTKNVSDLEIFFEHCEFNYLPQFHYSIASSILSQFYLTDFDNSLEKISVRENLEIIRYVDDMYIIYIKGTENRKKNNDLLNEINYYLWRNSLALNTSKTEFLSILKYNEITESLAESFEGFSSNSVIKKKATEIVQNGNLNLIVEELCRIEEKDGIDLPKYKELMKEYVAIDGGEVNKVFNNIIFSNKWKRLSTNELIGLIKSWKFIFFNPNQFTVLYLMVYRHLEKNKIINDNGLKIRGMLNHLFLNDTFTLRDSLVSVSYLFQSNLRHRNLINKVNDVNPEYVNFIQSFIIK